MPSPPRDQSCIRIDFAFVPASSSIDASRAQLSTVFHMMSMSPLRKAANFAPGPPAGRTSRRGRTSSCSSTRRPGPCRVEHHARRVARPRVDADHQGPPQLAARRQAGRGNPGRPARDRDRRARSSTRRNRSRPAPPPGSPPACPLPPTCGDPRPCSARRRTEHGHDHHRDEQLRERSESHNLFPGTRAPARCLLPSLFCLPSSGDPDQASGIRGQGSVTRDPLGIP